MSQKHLAVLQSMMIFGLLGLAGVLGYIVVHLTFPTSETTTVTWENVTVTNNQVNITATAQNETDFMATYDKWLNTTNFFINFLNVPTDFF